MKRKILPYIFILVTFLSCRKTTAVTEDELYPMSFSPNTERISSEKRASAGDNVVSTTNSTLINKPFGVFGIYSDEEGSSNGTSVFPSSEAQEVGYTGGKWTYSPLQYWHINDFYRFRAYHPYSGGAITVTHTDSNADRIVIKYAMEAGKEDLLVGFNAVKADINTIKQRVPITFKHALCALRFKIAFKNAPEIEDDFTDRLTEFHLSGIIPTATLLYTSEKDNRLTDIIDWQTEYAYFDNGEYFKWTGNKEFGKYDGSNAVNIFDGTENMVFAIPQTCSSSEEKKTTLSFKTEKAGDAIHIIKMPTEEWKPGKIYTYTLLINASFVDLELTIKDWKEVQSNEDLYI